MLILPVMSLRFEYALVVAMVACALVTICLGH